MQKEAGFGGGNETVNGSWRLVSSISERIEHDEEEEWVTVKTAKRQ